MKNVLWVLSVQVLLVFLLVKFIDRSPPPADTNYEEIIRQTSPESVDWIERGSPGEAAALERFKHYWSNLTAENVKLLLPEVYAENIWFNDTVKTITNRSDLLAYMLKTAGHVDSCRVVVQDVAATDQGYYVRWQMTVVPKQAEAGVVWQSIGMTHLRFDAAGKVILHQDFWDAAGGLYEHLPGIGWILRNIRARL